MKKANLDIRQAANDAGIRLWQIADKLNINDVNFTKKLRHEMPDKDKQKIYHINCEFVKTECSVCP